MTQETRARSVSCADLPSSAGKSGVSVIITNYNYDHYLPACLSSVTNQTRLPDEIIVVDDGSTDCSLETLSRYPDLNVIAKANGGQASAFNAGFAASTGDLVIFLDADDLLHPNAIETVCRVWSTSLAAVSFGLEIINSTGEPLGQYPLQMPEFLLHATLLKDRAFPFQPTSGNVFRRQAIDWAFPLPDHRWRISADALLIRVASLSGAIRHIPQTLGAYRVHGHNNYFRDDIPQIWRLRRGLTDMAQAALDLAEMTPRAPVGNAPGIASLLIFGAIRSQVMRHLMGAARDDLVHTLDEATRIWRTAVGARGTMLLRLLRHVLPRSSAVQNWIAEPHQRLWIAQHLLDLAIGPDLRQQHTDALMPSILATCRPTAETHTELPLRDHVFGPEWSRDPAGQPADLCGDRGEIILRRSGQGPALLGLELTVPEVLESVKLSAFHNDQIIFDETVSGETDIELLLSAPASIAPVTDIVRIEVCPSDRRFWARLKQRVQPCHRLRLHSLNLIVSHSQKTGAVLPVSAETGFQKILPATRAGGMFETLNDDGPFLGPQDLLVIGAPNDGLPTFLSVLMSADQVPGWFDLKIDETILFQGWIGPGSHCLARLPAHPGSETGTLALDTTFRPNDPLSEALVEIDAIGLIATDAVTTGDATLLPTNLWLTEDVQGGFQPYLKEGWERIEDGSTVMDSTSAAFRFGHSPLPPGSDLSLQIDIAPLAPPAPSATLIFIVEVNGAEAVTLAVNDRELIEFPLMQHLESGSNVVAVTCHCMARTGPGDENVLAHPGLKLEGFGLTDSAGPASEISTENGETLHPVDMDKRVGRLKSALAADANAGVDDLMAMRREMLDLVTRASPAAAAVMLTPECLETFSGLGRRLPVLGDRKVCLEHASGTGESDWLIGLATALLCGPAFTLVPDLSLSGLPALDDAHAEVIARYLMADATPETAAPQLVRHTAYVCRLLREIRDLIASAPPDSPHVHLARRMLEVCDLRHALFAGEDLTDYAACLGAALEADMTLKGHALTPRPRAGSENGRLRVGVLINHLDPAPETWIVSALIATLPREQFDVRLFTLFRSESSSERTDGAGVFGLGGQSYEICVAEIRRHSLDVFLLGSHFSGASLLARIAAHRLARRQIALSAISPMTTGLSSFDAFAIGDLVAPPAFQAQHTEPVVRAPGTGQIFAFDRATKPAADNPHLLRARLGIDADALIMASGAMLDKIGADMLAAWMDILGNAPNSVLLLYPFAQNWMRDFDEAQFLKTLHSSCLQNGLDRDRIKVLAPISGDDVQQVLRLADLYLDSFPYSGATTVVEALSLGCPVVTCPHPTQRGSQGAGWLQAFGLDELVCETIADYSARTITLLNAPDEIRRLEKTATANRDEALAQVAFTAWFPEFLGRQAVAASKPVRAPNYLFHHVPKAGGTAIRRMLGTWFEIVENYREPWSKTPPPQLQIDTLRPDQLLCGHFNADKAPLCSFYPETLDATRWRRITFIRDPLETALSKFFYERDQRGQYDEDFKPISLSEFLKTYPGLYLEHFECTKDNWREAIDRYWFIGTLERLDDCMDCLADALDKPRIERPLPRANATPRDLVPTDEDIRAFTVSAAIDFEIYREICKRLAVRLGEQPLDQFPR